MSMKRHILSLFIVFLFLSTIVSAESDNTFVSSRYKCSIQGQPDWLMETSPQKGILVAYNHVDGYSTITLKAFTLTDVPSLNVIADKISQSDFNGWVKIGGKYGSGNDIFITGASNKYESVYQKIFLNDKGEKSSNIAAVAYYFKNKNVYVISATTKSFTYPSIKKDIRKMMKSFYIDENL
ncbi:MAG: hypothetical protein DKM50_12325 [Candidatus Margulisiibacteriota bacterium]|nr:MAG: hypothetical protein DKM50_12325 [Candidatus Margulisiibacteriota bacterium]HCY37328.1 hypothetical protein [Candidatus Margulisiibacteriota bacterium]